MAFHLLIIMPISKTCGPDYMIIIFENDKRKRLNQEEDISVIYIVLLE